MTTLRRVALDREAAASNMASKEGASPHLWAVDEEEGAKLMELLRQVRSLTPEEHLARLRRSCRPELYDEES